jgi:hypothetical protein
VKNNERKITKADLIKLDQLIEQLLNRTLWTEKERSYVRFMMVAQDLYVKTKKLPTIGEVRAEQNRRTEELRSTEAEHRRVMDSLGKPK